VTCGIVYITYGPNAKREAQKSIAGLKKHNDFPITIIDESVFSDNSFGARWAKLNIDKLVDYDKVLYLDADTRILGDISSGFEFLDDWDLVIAISDHQDTMAFAHIKTGERLQTVRELCYRPIQLQAGVMFFHRQRCAKLFEAWRKEWQRWKLQDQAALLRALQKEPVKVWLLSKEWNSLDGSLIKHLFGRAR